MTTKCCIWLDPLLEGKKLVIQNKADYKKKKKKIPGSYEVQEKQQVEQENVIIKHLSGNSLYSHDKSLFFITRICDVNLLRE